MINSTAKPALKAKRRLVKKTPGKKAKRGACLRAKQANSKLSNFSASYYTCPSASSSNDAVAVIATAWVENVVTRDWVPQRTKKDGDGNADLATPCDRFDISGTTGVNELVLRHGTMSASELRTSRRPALFQRVLRGRTQVNAKQSYCAASSPPQFLLERYLSNLVRAVVHPLHNFLQCHHGLHNADEVQVMLMPKDGPIAVADRVATASTSSDSTRTATSSPLRRCYVATNNETLTEGSLQSAVRGWGVAGVFQISDFVLVQGEKGQHAEQKLLSFLRGRILSSRQPCLGGSALTAKEKALVVGERLPCVACRLFAILYEDISVLLPSHGHMYLSTIAPSLAALESSTATALEEKREIIKAYGSPAAAAKLLLSSSHQRVLR
jgi:hypothetical protein